MGKILKIILAIFGSMVIFVAVIFLVVFQLTSGLTKTANGFLGALRAGQYEVAYSYTSTDFHRTISQEQLQTLTTSGHELAKNEAAYFSNRSVKNNAGTLEGTVTIKGAVVPLTISLVREGDAWKIYDIVIDNQSLRAAVQGFDGGTVYISNLVTGTYDEKNNLLKQTTTFSSTDRVGITGNLHNSKAGSKVLFSISDPDTHVEGIDEEPVTDDTMVIPFYYNYKSKIPGGFPHGVYTFHIKVIGPDGQRIGDETLKEFTVK